MPIKSYLAYPAKGRRDELAAALRRLGGCEVLPAVNRDLLVLVTDTPHEAADDSLQSALAAIPALEALALVAGLGEAAMDGHDAAPGAEEEGPHDPA
ncbi:MAG TPA: hypothetical protein VIA61_08770 [Methylomirabilota bacterium]|jgi:hypothetical protein